MPCFTQKVINNRILMAVLISPIRDDEKVVVNLKNSFRALVDTGATLSCITHKVADNLGIAPIDKIKMQTAAGLAEKNLYCINLYIPVNIPAIKKTDSIEVNLKHFSKIEVSEVSLSDHYDVIIGMDVIMAGSLHVSAGYFTFCT